MLYGGDIALHALPSIVVQLRVGNDGASFCNHTHIVGYNLITIHVYVSAHILEGESTSLACGETDNATGDVVVHYQYIADFRVDVKEFHVRNLHAVGVGRLSVVGKVHLVVHVVEHQLVGRHRKDFVLLFLARLLAADNRVFFVHDLLLSASKPMLHCIISDGSLEYCRK